MKATIVVLLAISLVVTGCSTTRFATPGDIEAGAGVEIHAGDRATLHLKSGEIRTLKVSAVDNQTLTGTEGRGASARNVQIALTDIQSMQVRRVSGLRTAGLVVAVVVGVAVVAVGGILVGQCGVKLNDCGD